ncbi:hypothetical protein ATJ88_0689 [Isoptericola jiangsuensis]|uniref:Lipoprotein n=1 Tax=Isoptericola jiangsuensis TaxID=548579 RepID=A0A2A9EV55_9MICO|nr:hypothetical protein [Isoptericola jiangsuensis]PFG42039.1 hypothetical protein ATJ88_0689 [Isoptericola jiangsuensis]
MKKHKLHPSALGAAVLLAASMSACASGAESEDVVYHPTYAEYASITELEESSDLVIAGTPVSSEVRKIDVSAEPPVSSDPELDPNSGDVEGDELSSTFVYTVYEVVVDDVIAGKPSGDTIEVGFLGGSMDGVIYREQGGTDPLSLEVPIALYLVDFDGAAPYQPVNSSQAVYVETSPGKFESVALDNSIEKDVVTFLESEVG